MNGISKWLKDKQDNILIPNTLTKTVFNDNGENLDEILLSTTYTHPNSGVTAGSYSNVTVNAQGHVTTGRDYVHAASAGGGTGGYLNIATLTVVGTYQNEPIVIELSRRGVTTTCTLYIAFSNAANTDPGIGSFVYVGSNYNCYLYKAATSTWHLYVTKAESWDNISVVRYNKPNYMSGVTIQWTDVFASSVPSGATIALLSSTVASSIHTHTASEIDGGSPTFTSIKSSEGIITNGTLSAPSVSTANATTNTLTLSGGGIQFKPGGTVINPGAITQTTNSLTITAPQETNGRWGSGLEIKDCTQGIYPVMNSVSTGGSSYSMNLGSSTRKFGNIYSVATSLSSDAKLKKDIESLSHHKEEMLQVFDNLDFVRYRWAQNMNGGIVDPPSSRYHFGLIAQPVESTLKDAGFYGSDSGIMQTNFFADNTTGAWIAGGYQPPKDGYNYSQNVWNYKHDKEYEWVNEVIEKDLSEFNVAGIYNVRKNIGYIMFEDISKVQAEGKQPPLRINGIYLITKDGESVELPLTESGISYYDSENDKDLTTPLSSSKMVGGSLEIRFDKMWSSFMVEVPTFDYSEYQTIILDVDYIGEYKCYLIPEGEHKNANVWDRDNNDQILYDYSLNYNEIYTLCLYALQETRKEFLDYKEQTSKEIAELRALIQKGSE